MFFNRPGVARAVLQTPLSFIQSATDPFPPHLQNIISPKPLEQGTSNFDTMFTNPDVSWVRCHVSHVTCDVSHVKCKKKIKKCMSNQDTINYAV